MYYVVKFRISICLYYLLSLAKERRKLLFFYAFKILARGLTSHYLCAAKRRILFYQPLGDYASAARLHARASPLIVFRRKTMVFYAQRKGAHCLRLLRKTIKRFALACFFCFFGHPKSQRVI